MTDTTPLEDFPRPNVAVDLALLTVVPAQDSSSGTGRLCVLVQRRTAKPRGSVLPGRFIRERHTIEETVQEVLELKLGVSTGRVSPTLLRTFSTPGRDARAWTISIAHAVTLPAGQVAGIDGELVPIDLAGGLATGEKLLFDHGEIVREAALRIRERYESAPDPDGLLEEPFTLAQLRHLHEAVLGERLRKDTFSRRMKGQLEGLTSKDGSELTRTSIGRPAQLFRKKDVDAKPGTTRWQLPRAQ